MTNKKILLEMLAMVLTFGLVLAGCATTSDGTEPSAATKLVKDLNAIKAGSAKTSGGTVTLSDRVGLKKALTVPAGVTLDLTAEGAALELQDGAVLTVNGTVKTSGHGDHGKGHVDGSLRVGDGAAVINGSGTINLTSKGRLLNIGGDKGKRLTLDGVTLAGLPDNDSSLVGIYENSALILKSGAITGNTRLSDKHASGGGVEVHKGTFTMEGGTISGNSAQGKDGSGGGGVRIGEEAVFTMTDGTITGNSASGDKYSDGGGVSVHKGTFTMERGEISGNRAQGEAGGSGGGVNIGEESVFTMSGGSITGNAALGDSGNTALDRSANGGGVYIAPNKAVFTMSGGTISGNTSTDGRAGSGGGVSIGGGPVLVEVSTFTMRGGTISGNTATGGAGGSAGGGVRLGRSGVLLMEGGTIYGKAESLPAGTDASLANSALRHVSLYLNNDESTAKWGAGGTYTKGGVSQTGDSDIVRPGTGTDDTLIAVP